jgi:hypothetical protein
MIELKQYEVWFVTGSQHLYGPETLEQVAKDSREIAAALEASASIPVKVVFKPVLTTPEVIRELCLEANSARNCVGLITWMHTFSPAKMWIAGLSLLKKPFLHLHTQFGREIPWSEIDMNFMNLHQSAHGDREFGFIGSRLRLSRKVVVGHWQDEGVQAEIGVWTRAASAWADWQGAKIARWRCARCGGDRRQGQLSAGLATMSTLRVGSSQGVSENFNPKSTRRKLISMNMVPTALHPGGEIRKPEARIELVCGASEAGNSKASQPPSKIYTDWATARLAVQRDARWLWLRRGRGLENVRIGARHEGDERWHAGRRQFHGGLHLSLQWWFRRQSAGRAHARGL